MRPADRNLIQSLGADWHEERGPEMRYYLNLLAQSKLPTVVALAVLLGATLIGWYWVWGIFFLYWAVSGIVMGHAFVVQTVNRDESPVLFWLVSVTWLVLAGLMILYDLFPETAQFWLGESNV